MMTSVAQFQPGLDCGREESGHPAAVCRSGLAPALKGTAATEALGKTTTRVAYLVNQYPLVSHTFIRREIRALERRGIDVLRIGIRGWDASVADAEDKTERARTRYVLKAGYRALAAAALRLMFSRPRRFGSALVSALKLTRKSPRALHYHLIYLAEACIILEWLEAENVDHLHAHFGTNPAEVALLVRLLGGPPYSFTVHGPDEFDSSPFLHLDRKIDGTKFVVSVNSYCRAQLFRRAAAKDWGKIKVVHCGLEDEFHDGETAPLSLDRRLVCVGRLCEQKGQLILLEAFSRLSKSLDGCHLVLAGDGEMRAQIEERIAALGLQDSVAITGWIDSAAVRNEILSARALVLSSFQESLPVVIMEAMALRRPVVCTNVAGIPELVTDGENGWLVPAGSIEPLVEGLRVCLTAPPAILQQMGQAARERVLERHSIDREATKLAALFQIDEVSQDIEEWRS